MKRAFILSSLILLSTNILFTSKAFSFVGTFYAPALVPDKIVDVKFDAYNYSLTHGEKGDDCGDMECYRIDVYLNDIHVATFPTSPGKPHPGKKHVGGFTPIYKNGVPVHTITSHDYVSYKYRYYMPYAMFFESQTHSGRISNIAIHSGHAVNGKRLSKGCLRTLMDDAALMFKWTREARKNGGNGYLWTRHTKDRYY